ncbi:TPA: hypothetical protein N2D10_003228 [Clostridium botulinum]|nr:hypothetical protein [Clostridium botulinum]
MEFAKYYKATNKLNKLLEQKKVFSYTKDYCTDLFICEDTHVFWICRILEGYNEEYEKEDEKWLVERNKIDKYDFIGFVEEKYKEKFIVRNRQDRDNIINSLDDSSIKENVILFDDDQGLENWDNYECNSYEEAISIIDGGHGIID